MRHVPTCFITYDFEKTYGLFAVAEALGKLDIFSPKDALELDTSRVKVWNLGWRSAQPLELARPFLLADLRKAKYVG